MGDFPHVLLICGLISFGSESILHMNHFIFIKTYLMAQNFSPFCNYFLYTWKEYMFCHSWIEYSVCAKSNWFRVLFFCAILSAAVGAGARKIALLLSCSSLSFFQWPGEVKIFLALEKDFYTSQNETELDCIRKKFLSRFKYTH